MTPVCPITHLHPRVQAKRVNQILAEKHEYCQCSQRSGGPGGPTGNCQEDWTGPDDNFYSVPSWDILGLQGLSKDHGPHKVRHYYTVLIKGPQGTVVDCRSPDKDGGDL